ncbi:hypothetical protein GCM10009865_10160 [Aeromicrobium ponti]|uniref:Uncharacterized protein n=1 Tax=Cytobacillus oceanisediminis TaxID=665099 RepID=A0A562J4B0_9BACI|nr:hypothetical protein [Cytobacillus oceanisediminis]TWH78039.1 hypothetical protein IQ19_05507 [Cytobacillus oceanisediminis]
MLLEKMPNVDLISLDGKIRGEVEKVELEDQYFNPSSHPSDLELQLAQTKFKL